jgi:hypothetical protein
MAYIKKRFRNPDDLLLVDLSPFHGRSERCSQSSQTPENAGTRGRTRNNMPWARRGRRADMTQESSERSAHPSPDDGESRGGPYDVPLAVAFPDRHPNDISMGEGFLSFPGAHHQGIFRDGFHLALCFTPPVG